MRQPDATAPMQPVSTKQASGYAWARRGLGFAVVSQPSTPGLQSLSGRVQAQLAERT